jgi:hypothetical protein
MEFFTSRRKVTSKWTASYATDQQVRKRMKTVDGPIDKASFDGKM